MASAPESRPLFVLNVHADYQCRHAGACCTAGWHIPIEQDRFNHLRRSLSAGVLALPEPADAISLTPDPTARGVAALDLATESAASRDIHAACFSTDSPPDGAAAILNHDHTGACVFFDRRGGKLCAIHRACGHEWLPVACQQFPRVALVDARGTHLTLSHFCPTAARLLFRDDVDDLTIEADPAGPICRDAYEGFDATATLPPFVRPGLVGDMDVAAMWDAFAINSLACESVAPEAALVAMIHVAERIREWKPGSESLATVVRNACDAALGTLARSTRVQTMAPSAAARLYLAATASVPAGLTRPELPENLNAAHARWIAPVWSMWHRPIRRYLAAKAVAAWSAYCGEGLRTRIAMLAVALGVLEVESARQAELAGRELDAEVLLEAIRMADLLMVHLASEQDLVRRMGRVEKMTLQAYVAEIGLNQP